MDWSLYITLAAAVIFLAGVVVYNSEWLKSKKRLHAVKQAKKRLKK
jgi:hypothetical protein